MPLLLLKSGHMNPRVKQACLELVLLLAKAYHIIPHSVIKYLLKPPKPTASPRYIIARLDALHLVLMKSGVDDMKQLENAGSGLTIKSAMTFTEPQLHNKTTEIREAAVKVIIDLCLLVDNDELIFSYLTNIKHQTLHIIQTRLELARHGKEIQNEKEGEKLSETVSSETLVATDSAIRSPGSIPPGLGTISSEEQLVKNLKNEIQDLKGIVQERKMLDKQPTSKKSNTKESTAISTAPLVNDSVTASVKPKPKVKPSPSAKRPETREMKSNDPVATRTPKPPTPIELEQPLEVITRKQKGHSRRTREEDDGSAA
ncbi:hypothetical protein BDR26DRAFT_10008 [Obelidium mucronatum]|nr:hypothetical protein BDR26DRAFT_10008 [Obelidium mucronatum]